eukprot:CAMPEP_0117668170 /NCGR_PEP_ID=MMETSP0804-20121206/11390_1 /TAXON_ID=1074897 /ORGANISM="Tetraselmis astigmatica, Strain CCMP880" /LENGTH=385 /DNA_ID=CAMNT_0005476011 /DNA_START=67 /DNA_END=1225 /DNA_ORIENTATION=+
MASTAGQPSFKVAREWAAAGVGCSLADTVFNPLEVLKVRLQTASSAHAPGQVHATPSVASIAREAISKKGFVSGLLEPGLMATWMRGLSYTGFRIGLYPAVRDQFGNSIGGRIAAGALTGAIGSALFNPVDIVRIRMQAPVPQYPNTIAAFSAIQHQEGLQGLWRGYSASMLRAAMLSGSQLATYDTTKRALLTGPGSWGFSQDGPALQLTASCVSGLVAQTVTQPADTLKTLVMSQKTDSRQKGVLEMLVATFRRGGFRAFYAGYFPALGRQGPVMLVQMPLVEQLRKVFGLDYMWWLSSGALLRAPIAITRGASTYFLPGAGPAPSCCDNNVHFRDPMLPEGPGTGGAAASSSQSVSGAVDRASRDKGQKMLELSSSISGYKS